MAEKYKSQVTNKWIGSSYKGTVRHIDARNTEMGQIVSALRNDLTPAMNNWGEKHIERKKTDAGAKMDELYAQGWTTKDIQKAILNDEIPELSNQYAKSVVDTHSGRFEAAETIRQIEANIDKYDYKDGTKTLEEFYKEYLPDFNEASSQFTVGFSAVFNEWSANAKIKDAENRATHAHTVKIDKAIGFMDTTTSIEDIKNGNYFKKLMTLNTEMPISKKDGKAYFFDTNELNEEIALGHARWLIDTATSEEALDKAITLLTQDRGKGKGGNELGSLMNTYSKESRELILALNNKRIRIQNDDRQKEADAEKEDVSALLAELMTDVDEVIAGETKTRKRTHTENLKILEKLAAYGNPSYINAYEKLIDVNAWKESDPAIFNGLISSIRDGDFEDLGEVLDAMVELGINPDDWKSGLVYFKEFDDDRKNGLKPIYQRNETYSTGIKVNLTAVKGNFMKKVGDMWVEQPNSGVALANAQFYMEKQIVEWDKNFEKDNGRKPTEMERNEFMNNLQAVVVKQFNKDNISPILKSYSEYEEEVLANRKIEEEKVKALEAKNKSYKEAGVTQMIENVTKALDINEKDLKLAIPEFDDDIFWSDTDFFDLDATDEREFNEAKIVPILTDRLEQFMGDVKWNDDMMALMEDSDYKAFRDNIIDTLTSFGIRGININTVEKALKAIAQRNNK